MSKITEILQDLISANELLTEAIEKPDLTKLERDGAIQRFEFTYELSWKLIQEIARDQQSKVLGSKDAYRFAAKIELIDDPQIWFNYHVCRNQTSHIYNEIIAENIFEQIKPFHLHVKTLIQKVQAFIE